MLVPVSQVSVVQALPSVQSPSPVQQFGTGVCVHCCRFSSHVSTVHIDASSQGGLGGLPVSQAVPSGLQVSTPLQNRPSLQVSAWLQMCCPVSQLSLVQALPSSHSASVWQQPATGEKVQTPGSLQLSVVQTSPSSQRGACTQVFEPVSHVSTVQPRASSHSAFVVQQFDTGVWTQAPVPSHPSAVQAFPSSVQAVPAGVKQLRAAGSQVLLHSSPLAHGSPPPLETHMPPVQVSLLQKLQSVSTVHEA